VNAEAQATRPVKIKEPALHGRRKRSGNPSFPYSRSTRNPCPRSTAANLRKILLKTPMRASRMTSRSLAGRLSGLKAILQAAGRQGARRRVRDEHGSCHQDVNECAREIDLLHFVHKEDLDGGKFVQNRTWASVQAAPESIMSTQTGKKNFCNVSFFL
jgi:hypothetical protein